MEDLKACPFCGGTGEIVVLEDEDGRFAAAACPSCGAGSRQHYFCGEDAREFAADAWNTRAPLSAETLLSEALEVLRLLMAASSEDEEFFAYQAARAAIAKATGEGQ